jgi:tRNA-2-methylthio-N6-dimethylallyladenosine synthase
MNYSDAERISTILEKSKLKKASSIDEAGLIIFVTCGVRQSAEDRVYGQINNIRKKYPKKKIVLTGCLALRKDVQRRLKEKVVLFCEIKDFPEEIKKISRHSGTPPRRWLNTKYKIPATKTEQCNNYLRIIPKYASPYTAYVPIMTGCNNFCSYCVVPYARGREYSRPAKDILREIGELVKRGYREIILLGQNVNSYNGSNKSSSAEALAKEDEFINFPKLLQSIEKIPGHFWITFLTSHPKDMSDELIKAISKSLSASGGQKICEYISLPAQSGDNDILRRMNRRYTIAHYRNLIKKIRSAYKKYNPSCLPSISTDIIVGFPGETKRQFENSAKLMREMKFDMAYIAQYSSRPETAAWKLKDDVSKKEKERRENVLTEILKKTALENNKKYIGKVVEVLVDKKLGSKLSFEELRANNKQGKSLALEPHKYLAHTRTQKKVLFYSNKKIPIGDFTQIRITKVKAFSLEGEIL